MQYTKRKSSISSVMQPLRRRGLLTGFTFIEMLIVMAMLSVVSLAIYASLSNGIKIWQRTYNSRVPEEDAAIILDKFASDVRNSVSFSTFDFLGEKDRCAFATVVNSQELQKATVGKAAYTYNQQAGIMSRSLIDFSQIFSGRSGAVTHSLGNIKSLKFEYYYFSKEKQEYLWQDEAAGGMPLAVRIELEYMDGAKTKTVTRAVSIPIAG